jgi:adenine-specific DNA-methyltransferase
LHLLYIPWHFPLHLNPNIKGASLEAEEAFKIGYPAVYNHLLKYKKQLVGRNQAETGIRYEWYALQRWGADYWNDFEKPKIIFQEIVQEPCFMLDAKDNFMCLDTARIIVGKRLNILLAILNSKLFFYTIKVFYGGGGLGENAIRMKHTFFLKFPAPNFDLETSNTINQIITNNDKNKLVIIDKIIYDFF